MGSPADLLSRRGWSNVEEIMPRIEAAVREREKQHRETHGRSSTNDTDESLEGQPSVPMPPKMIDLSTAEDWSIRQEVLEISTTSLSNAFTENDFSYPGGFAGSPMLLKALAGFFNSHFSPLKPVTEDHIVVAPGAAGCLDTLLYNICDPGDGVLIPAPYWSAFDFVLKARNSVEILPVQVSGLDRIFTEDLIDSLELAVATSKVRCRALILCNPQNPLAQCYPLPLIHKVLQFCQKHDLHYISDEIFALTRFRCPEIRDPVPFSSVLSIDLNAIQVASERVHTVWSTSKDFGQNGVRLGAIVTQNNVTLRTAAALSANTTVSSFTAVAVASLLQHDDLTELLSRRSDRLAPANNALVRLLNKHEIPFIPAYAGLFVFAQIAPWARTWDDEAAMIKRLKDVGISVAAGKSYHMPDNCKGWARISFSVREHVLAEAIERMDAVFSQHNEGYLPDRFLAR